MVAAHIFTYFVSYILQLIMFSVSSISKFKANISILEVNFGKWSIFPLMSQSLKKIGLVQCTEECCTV